ncbi:MAG: hypothetical protein ACRDNS_30090, partial [Trebonia sp.]
DRALTPASVGAFGSRRAVYDGRTSGRLHAHAEADPHAARADGVAIARDSIGLVRARTQTIWGAHAARAAWL